MNDKEKTIEKYNKFLDKYINPNRINHAYLLETNYNDRLLLIELLIEKILSYENNISYKELELNNDLLIIDADTIKTDSIENLKEEFKTKSVNDNKRFYVILSAEKMNDHASNKLLKFIEEPENDIIAILVTENKNNVINTIVSRCQILRFFIATDRFEKYDEEYINELFEFVLNIEENKEKAIAFQNRYNIKKLSDRAYLQEFLNNILYVYDDAILYKTTNNVEYFEQKKEQLKAISDNNSIEDLKNKINAIYECINRLKYNPNVKLLIDKIIISMNGVDLL